MLEISAEPLSSQSKEESFQHELRFRKAKIARDFLEIYKNAAEEFLRDHPKIPETKQTQVKPLATRRNDALAMAESECHTPLPLCMLLTVTEEELAGRNSYSRPVHGWNILCEDLPRSQGIVSDAKRPSSKELLFNSEKFPIDALLKLDGYLKRLQQQLLDTIDSLHHLRTLFPQEATNPELDNEITALHRRVQDLQSQFFDDLIFPRLAFILPLIHPRQSELLCWLYTQNLLSTGPMLMSPFFSEALHQQNARPETVNHYKFLSTGAAVTKADISFSDKGMEVTALAQGIYANVQNDKEDSEPETLQLIQPSPKIIIKFKSEEKAFRGLPCTRIMTDSHKLARIFFEIFCKHRLEIHRQQISKLSPAPKSPNPRRHWTTVMSLSPVKQSTKEKSPVLIGIYEALLNQSLSDTELRTLLTLFSTFALNASSVDNFLVANQLILPEHYITINAVLLSLPEEAYSENSINLVSYDLDIQRSILKIFTVFLAQQQRFPKHSARLEKDRLYFENATLTELRGFLKIHEVVNRLLKKICLAEKAVAKKEVQPTLVGLMDYVYNAVERDDKIWLEGVFPFIQNQINKYHRGRPPLVFQAIVGGKVKVVKFLTANNVKLDLFLKQSTFEADNFKEYDGYAPLHIAAREGNSEIIEALLIPMLHTNISLELTTRTLFGLVKGKTALDIAQIYNHHEAIALISLYITKTTPNTKIDQASSSTHSTYADTFRSEGLSRTGIDFEEEAREIKAEFKRQPLFQTYSPLRGNPITSPQPSYATGAQEVSSASYTSSALIVGHSLERVLRPTGPIPKQTHIDGETQTLLTLPMRQS